MFAGLVPLPLSPHLWRLETYARGVPGAYRDSQGALQGSQPVASFGCGGARELSLPPHVGRCS